MSILIQHANTLVTMDAQRREITNAAILVEGSGEFKINVRSRK
jgi:hypothetical protein